MIEMLRVHTPADIDSVVVLARDIWTKHYYPIIGKAQTDYMLAKYQSASAIARQIGDGCQYYLVMENSVQAGYFAVFPAPGERTALLSKIYVREELRRRGIGLAILVFMEARCVELGLRTLWLKVNRHNAGAIAFYQRMGFVVMEKVVQDIGDGFVTDDFKMAKVLGQTPSSR